MVTAGGEDRRFRSGVLLRRKAIAARAGAGLAGLNLEPVGPAYNYRKRQFAGQSRGMNTLVADRWRGIDAARYYGMTTPLEVRFIADAMLQSLAKWLRLLGYDCLAGEDLFGRKVLELAAAERRWLLTRNRRLESSQPRALLDRTSIFQVTADALPEQLREVTARFELDSDAFAFTRCVRCNASLTPLENPDDAPARVRELQTRFWRCPACGRVYWQGSHVERSVRRLADWLKTGTA